MSEWKRVKIGDVMKFRKESICIDDDAEYRLCRVQLHRRGVVTRQTQKGIEIRTKKQYLCKKDDFIVAEMDAKFGGYGIIPQELDGAIVSSHYYLFEVNQQKLLVDFLRIVLKTTAIQNQIKAKGSTNYSSIRPKEILNFSLNIPDIATQLQIVERHRHFELSYNGLSAQNTLQRAYLALLRQQILQEKSVGTVKLKSHVTHLAKRVNASTPSHRMIGVSNSDGITDLITNKKEGFEKYKLVEKHSFIYNPMRINVGSIALYEENATCITSPDYVVFRVSNEYPIKALLFFLKFKQGLQEIAENVQGSVRQRLYFENLCNINIPEFASKDYKVIEDLFSNLDKLEDLINQNKENAEILMQAFLAEVFKKF